MFPSLIITFSYIWSVITHFQGCSQSLGNIQITKKT